MTYVVLTKIIVRNKSKYIGVDVKPCVEQGPQSATLAEFLGQTQLKCFVFSCCALLLMLNTSIDH